MPDSSTRLKALQEVEPNIYQAPVDLPGWPLSRNISIDTVSLNSIAQSLVSLFSGSAVYSDAFHGGEFQVGFSSTTLQSMFNSSAFVLEQVASNVATVVTNVIRQQSDRSAFVQGQAYDTETFIDIRWAWLAYAAAIEVVAVVFFVSVLIKTSRSGIHKVWKASVIAILFHGLQNKGDSDKNLAEARETSEMQELAGKIRVRLVREDNKVSIADASTCP